MADRYLVATGNWSATSTWSATSGGASGASVPVAADNVYLDATYTLTVDVTDAVCTLLTLGGTTIAPIINGNTITVLGGITYAGTSGAITGTTVLVVAGTGTLSAPSRTTGSINCPVQLNTAGIVTISTGFVVDMSKFRYIRGTITNNRGTFTPRAV